MKDILNYEGLYQVTTGGAVYAINTKRWLKPKIVKDGVLVVRLSKNGIKKRFLVHRLVALAYIPNIDNKPQVDHIDGNKHNNHVSNLRWCTNTENQEFRDAQGNSGKNDKAKLIQWGDDTYGSIGKLAKVIAESRGSSHETVRKELKAVRYGGKVLYGKWCQLV